MSLYIVSILKIVLVLCAAAVVYVDHLRTIATKKSNNTLDKSFLQKRTELAYGILAILAVFAWTNAAHFYYKTWIQPGEPVVRYVVHTHEQFHFYLGAKYFPEIGYGDLYYATNQVLQEQKIFISPDTLIRDPLTFTVSTIDNPDTIEKSIQAKQRFSESRWQTFSADVYQYFVGEGGSAQRIFIDHGNTGSPAWSMLPWALSQLTDLNLGTFGWFALLDIVLLIVSFWAVFRTFGVKAGALALVVFAVFPYSFDFTFGSLLRFDWLAAVLLGICALQQKHYRWAGIALAYAIASKVFPVIFLIGTIPWLASQIKQRQIKPVKQFVGAGVLCLVCLVGLSSALFGIGSWRQYSERIATASQKDNYNYSYSMTVGIQNIVISGPIAVINQGLAPAATPTDLGIISTSLPYPAVNIIGKLMIMLGIFWLIYKNRRDPVIGMGLASGLLFVWLSLYMYYIIFLVPLGIALVVLAKKQSRMLGWLITLAATATPYLYHMHKNNEPIALAATSTALTLWFFAFVGRWVVYSALCQWRLSHTTKSNPAS
jgi:hypothetical protein